MADSWTQTEVDGLKRRARAGAPTFVTEGLAALRAMGLSWQALGAALDVPAPSLRAMVAQPPTREGVAIRRVEERLRRLAADLAALSTAHGDA